MDFTFTDDQRMIQEAVRKFAREQILPQSRDWDHQASFPRELLTEMGKLGYLGVPVPDDYDGQPLEIPNDAVIVSAGGILPTPFLKSTGIEVETKYGSA